MSRTIEHPPAISQRLFDLAASDQPIGAVWHEFARRACLDLGGDAGVALENLGDDRARIAASFGWPIAMPTHEFPVAPDSQAAFVFEASSVVITDVAGERRYQPSEMVRRAGFARSCSTSVRLGGRQFGLIGVQFRDAREIGPAAARHLSHLAAVLGLVLHHRAASSQVALLIDHDPLTGLLNRRGVFEQLEAAIPASEIGSLLLLDLDGFKRVNDEHGHAAGDRVLEVVGARLRRAVRPGDIVGRLSGDEFLVWLSAVDASEAITIGERIIGHVEQIIDVRHAAVAVSASVGVAELQTEPGADWTMHDLIDAADDAMYVAKRAGRGLVRLAPPRVTETASSPRPRAPAPAATVSVAALDDAIERCGCAYQLIVDARTGRAAGIEALLRGPAGPLAQPATLIRCAETWDRIVVLELACKRLAFAADLPHDLDLFVNIDPAALTAPGFVDLLRAAWQDSVHAARGLVIELTERHLREHPGRLLRAVELCREAGWRVALDDVGARAESLTALNFVRPDIVKLDLGLITGSNSSHVASTTVALAAYSEGRQVDVVAEGIETEEQEQIAVGLGATHLQGFRYSTPVGAAGVRSQITDLVNTFVARPATRPGRARRRHLVAVSRHLESLASHPDSVVLASFQRMQQFTPLVRAQYAALARRCGMVGVLAVDATVERRDGVHFGTIPERDPLAGGWCVVVVHPEGGVALVARPSDATGEWFDFELTVSRERVDAVASGLLRFL